VQPYSTARSNAHSQIGPWPTDACVKLCGLDNALLEIGNTQYWINHLVTKAIAFGSGKIRPSIFFIIVFIASNHRFILFFLFFIASN